MKKHLLTLVAIIMASSFAFAQEAAIVEEKKEGWFRAAGIGLDAGQLSVINPRVGAGENRINLGGAASAITLKILNRNIARKRAKIGDQ